MSIAEAEAPRMTAHPNDHTPMRADEQAQRSARRKAERGPNPNPASELASIKEQLKAQEQITITLHQRLPSEEQLPARLVGYQGFFVSVPRGKRVKVARSIYEILVSAGEVAPETDEDEKLVPTRTWMPLGPNGDNIISRQEPIDLVY